MFVFGTHSTVFSRRNKPMIEQDINKIIIFYRSSKASIKTEDLAKAIVFNATKKTITEGKTETIEHADILDISKEATEIPKVSLNLIH